MKHLKKVIRLCGLIMYITLAVAGIAMSGRVPPFTKNRLFIDNEMKIELVERKKEKDNGDEELKF